MMCFMKLFWQRQQKMTNQKLREKKDEMQHLKMLSLNVTISNLDCSAAQKKNNPSIGCRITS